MGVMRSLLLATIGAAALAACGGADPTFEPEGRLCDAETRADVFRVGLEAPSAEAMYTLVLEDSLVEGQFGPPDRGMNTWTVGLVDGSGAAMTGAEVQLKPWMPDHGHGTSPELHYGRPVAGGYELGPFNLHMGGYWEFRFTVTASSASDTAQLGFCVEG